MAPLLYRILYSRAKTLSRFGAGDRRQAKIPAAEAAGIFYVWVRERSLRYAFFFPAMLRMTNRVPIIRTIAMGRETMLWVKPAIM